MRKILALVVLAIAVLLCVAQFGPSVLLGEEPSCVMRGCAAGPPVVPGPAP